MNQGSLHPITQMLRVAVSALGDLGFDIVETPDLDTSWYVFDSLNMEDDHPARSPQDTFYLQDGRVLRPHVSNGQLRTVEQIKPPLRVMYMGNSFRNDATDATHEIVFTQLECLVIEEGATLANLLATLDTFITRIFGAQTKYRFRPHQFPYTEPSIEVDIWHEGKWIELLGAGMVHPQVLKNMKIDPTIYSGFAFGTGMDRFALRKWGIEDIRLFHSNKAAFLRQFRGES